MSNNAVRKLQMIVGSEPDNVFGPDTAIRFAAFTNTVGRVDEALMQSIRSERAALVPRINSLEAVYGPLDLQIQDDPVTRGACILIDKSWANNLRTLSLPGNHRVTLHRFVVPDAIAIFAEILSLRLPYKLTSVQSYCCRHMLWNPSKPLSDHARACALDLNPATNKYGTTGDLPDQILDIFCSWGWDVGRDWSTPDPMHVSRSSR